MAVKTLLHLGGLFQHRALGQRDDISITPFLKYPEYQAPPLRSVSNTFKRALECLGRRKPGIPRSPRRFKLNPVAPRAREGQRRLIGKRFVARNWGTTGVQQPSPKVSTAGTNFPMSPQVGASPARRKLLSPCPTFRTPTLGPL